MPTYQYECSACGHEFEELQSMSDAKLTKCPKCGKNKLDRLIGSGSGMIFKGSGFYETDYKKKTIIRRKPLPPANPSQKLNRRLQPVAAGADVPVIPKV
jgi:putative FmdB family regulatory protein